MDQTHTNLRTSLRALADVVTPAVDRDNARAQEQLHLAMDHVAFLLERLDYLYERHYYELRHQLHLADGLLLACEAHALPAAELLRAERDACRAELRSAATPDDMPIPAPVPVAVLSQWAHRLDEAASGLVQAANSLPPALRDSIEHCVLDLSTERIHFDRVWYAPLGFDPHAATLPPIASLLDDLRQPRTTNEGAAAPGVAAAANGRA